MPGRHVTDRQMRLFMKHRLTNPMSMAAVRAGLSTATGYRMARDPCLPSEKRAARERRRPDPLADVFDAEVVPMISKAQIMALVAGHSWLEKGDNPLAFGPPGGGKSHLAAAIGHGLIENGWRVLFARTTDPVQRPQGAQR